MADIASPEDIANSIRARIKGHRCSNVCYTYRERLAGIHNIPCEVALLNYMFGIINPYGPTIYV